MTRDIRVDMLAMSLGIDALLEQEDLDPAVVINFLIDEGLISLEDYFDGDIDVQS